MLFLGTRFEATSNTGNPHDVITKNGGPYFDFPPDRLQGGRFIDPLGERGLPGVSVTFYRFDNNDDDGGDDVNWHANYEPDGVGTDYPHNGWNVSNVHPNAVDIWSAGPDGFDLVCGLDAGGVALPTAAVHPRQSSVASLKHGYDNDGDGKSDEDPMDGVDNDGEDGTDEDHPEDFIGNW